MHTHPSGWPAGKGPVEKSRPAKATRPGETRPLPLPTTDMSEPAQDEPSWAQSNRTAQLTCRFMKNNARLL